MISIKEKEDFIGPKALFDPLYIPPKLLYRKKEENSLFSILDDCLTDNYSMNILYQGVEGIGKKVIINKVLRDLIKENDCLNSYNKINIDCKEKGLDEIIIYLLSSILRILNIKIDINMIINSKISQIWNIMKLAVKKLNNKIVIILNNSENQDFQIIKKILSFSKESKITTISTINQVLKPSKWEILQYYDLKRKLNHFSYTQLFDILKQRASLSFSHQIDFELIEYITDTIFDNYIPIPGKGVEILKDLFPYLHSRDSVKYNLLIEICENHFESFLIFDEFNMLSFLSEEDLLTMIFLDNLTNYFMKNSSNFYVNLESLKELYFISCETTGYNKSRDEFSQMIKKLENLGIINSSKKGILEKTDKYSNNHPLNNFYFISISPLKLKAMIDAIFEKNHITDLNN
ncbi:MAG: orc1/cdc6 family replication initiation protein [Candidatus Lokiarchaeota archaeon]|nr:orc1/cdc6 family replication initiation protein [Candidatus Lokiarchaeota archaeon]